MSLWAYVPPFIGKYNLGHTLGKGSFSIVKEGQDIETQAHYAVKIIPKSNLNTEADIERFEREVRVLLKMDHPGIIKIYDFLVDSSYFYLIMDLCKGDTLLNRILQPGMMDEESAKPLFKQILDTVTYIHEKGIAHRDLKLDNVLVEPNGNIKIIDFGFSKFANPGQMCMTPCGSPVYAAPEILDGQSYDGKLADMWSCGVLLYCLVTGELPWRSGNQMLVFNQIKKGSYDLPENLSENCKDLISKLLNSKPAERLTAVEASNHPWLEGIKITWPRHNENRRSISENTFVSLLNKSNHSSEEENQKLDPREVLKQIGTRSRIKSTHNGSFSFGSKSIPPMSGSIVRFGGTIVRESSFNHRNINLRRNSYVKSSNSSVEQ